MTTRVNRIKPHQGAVPSVQAKRRALSWGLSHTELALLLALAIALTVLPLLPVMRLPVGYHDFADARAWGAVPNALDVLSNGAFVVMGIWLWRAQRAWYQAARAMPPAQQQLVRNANVHVGVMVLGLLATAVCSGIYHWRPDDAHLCVDRLGMSVVFAGVLSLAVTDRISERAGWGTDLVLCVLVAIATVWAWRMNNMAAWVMVQGFGLGLLAVAACFKPMHGSLGVRWAWVVLIYGLAKALEVGDHAVFAWTGGLVSGHSLKHAMAAFAVLPVVLALQQQRTQWAQRG